MQFLAKIAVIPDRGATPPHRRNLASGDGWSVSEVVCTLGPRDQPFEEQHSGVAIAIVASGTFQYRSRTGGDLMTPGSLMLGSPGQYFECGHEHGTGDRCIAFSYAPEFFGRIGADPVFHLTRVPPVRELSPLIATASAARAGAAAARWEELAIELAAKATRMDRGCAANDTDVNSASKARVTRVVRMMERELDSTCDLNFLAREARLTPWHFLRTFRSLTGVTPHQYLLRLRLQRAAVRLRAEPGRILDIALDCGFGDVSNFNRTFRSEFGVTPRVWRCLPQVPAAD